MNHPTFSRSLKILARLWRTTRLENKFSANAYALYDGVPKRLGMPQTLHNYLQRRMRVVARRARHRRTAANERLEMVEAVRIAADNNDRVIRLIRAANTAAAAKQASQDTFGVTERQSQAIVDMPLRRLTRLSATKLADEAAQLGDYTRSRGAEVEHGKAHGRIESATEPSGAFSAASIEAASLVAVTRRPVATGLRRELPIVGRNHSSQAVTPSPTVSNRSITRWYWPAATRSRGFS